MASFIIRKIDDEVWKKFKERAAEEGHSIRWLLLQWIKLYSEGG